MGSLGLNITNAAPRPWWPADAVFAIDFVTGLAMRNRVICPLSEAMSFTRASPKFARTASGKWQSFGVDVPAITDLGITIEPERTNLVVANTANGGAGFMSVGTTRSDLAPGDSPAGDAFGKLVTQGAGATDALYFGLFNGLITAGSRHTISASFKYSGSTRYLRMLLSDNVSEVSQCWIDLVDKTLSNTTPGATARITPLVDNWVHVELTAGAYTSTTANAQFGVISVVGSGVSTRTGGSYYIWGGQVEKDEYTGSSPIITLANSVTRPPDALLLNTAIGPQTVTLHFADGTWQNSSHSGGAYAVPTSSYDKAIVRVVSS